MRRYAAWEVGFCFHRQASFTRHIMSYRAETIGFTASSSPPLPEGVQSRAFLTQGDLLMQTRKPAGRWSRSEAPSPLPVLSAAPGRRACRPAARARCSTGRPWSER